MQTDRGYKQFWENSRGWQDPPSHLLTCACTAAALEPAHNTHPDGALPRDALQSRCCSHSGKFLVQGSFTLTGTKAIGSYFCLWDTNNIILLCDKTLRTMAALFLKTYRNWLGAGFLLCTTGTGNVLFEQAGITQNTRLSHCYRADGGKEEEGRKW